MEQHDLSKIQKLQEKGKSDKIIKYLSSSDDTVVVAALEALSRIKDEDSVNSIRQSGYEDPYRSSKSIRQHRHRICQDLSAAQTECRTG